MAERRRPLSDRPDRPDRDGPVRVLHLIKSLGRGGAEVLLLETLRAGDRERFDYRFGYFLPHKDALAGALAREGAEVTCFPARSSAAIPLRVPTLARHLRRSGVDILHCHLSLAGVAGRLAGRLAGVPVVYTEHGPIEYLEAPSRLLNLWTWPLQERVIAVSEEVAASVRRHAGERVPLVVIENGVSSAHFAPDPARGHELRARLGIPPGAPVVGTVAVFRPQKRLADWLRVASALRARHPDLRLLVVGDGPERDAVAALAGELGLAEAVVFAGLQADVRPFLDAMDVYLMTSGFEGLPIALLEAMAMALPIVSTAVGGIVDAVDDSCGALAAVGDLPALAAAAGALVADPERRRALGDGARRRVEERFSMARMVARIEALYREVLEHRRR
jgi:glycosyltransferase involved in cell wall biosynthesis